jgi:hypothetical protein
MLRLKESLKMSAGRKRFSSRCGSMFTHIRSEFTRCESVVQDVLVQSVSTWCGCGIR